MEHGGNKSRNCYILDCKYKDFPPKFQTFWEKFSQFVLDSKGDKNLGQFCNELVNKFTFDNKNILKVKEMAVDISDDEGGF